MVNHGILHQYRVGTGIWNTEEYLDQCFHHDRYVKNQSFWVLCNQTAVAVNDPWIMEERKHSRACKNMVSRNIMKNTKPLPFRSEQKTNFSFGYREDL